MTIKEDFLTTNDHSGFARMLRLMIKEDFLNLEAHQRYCHRRSLTGNEMFYVAIVARKVRDVPMSLLRESRSASEPILPHKKNGHYGTLLGS
jgi:hypothetical protein